MLITKHFDYHPSTNWVIGSVPVVSRWLWPGNKTFLEVASMVVTWWSSVILRSVQPDGINSIHGYATIISAICMQNNQIRSAYLRTSEHTAGSLPHAAICMLPAPRSLQHTNNARRWWLYKKLIHLTLEVLNFWKFTTYCSLKPLRSGMGEVVPARTSPTLHPPSPPTVHQLSWLAL